MMGVARELCIAQAQKTGYPTEKLGILNKKQAAKFIDSYKYILNLEYDVYEIVSDY
jgi:hypothetical protein